MASRTVRRPGRASPRRRCAARSASCPRPAAAPARRSGLRSRPAPSGCGFCACSLPSSSRSTRSAARWNRLTVDQSRSSRSGSRRVSVKRGDQGVEDVGQRGADLARVGQRPGVGLVLEGAVAVELEFGEERGGRGCGVVRLVIGVGMVGHRGCLRSAAAPIAAFAGVEDRGRTGLAPPGEARAAAAQRRTAWGGYFASRVQSGRWRAGENSRPQPLPARAACRSDRPLRRPWARLSRPDGARWPRHPDLRAAPRSPRPSASLRRSPEPGHVLRGELHPDRRRAVRRDRAAAGRR